MESEGLELLLLCHSGDWDHLYQAASAASAMVAQDRRVDMVFFFSALERLLDGRLDEISLGGSDPIREERLRECAAAIRTQPVSVMLDSARESGKLRFFACSASVLLTGRTPEEAGEMVDEIIGWPTIVRLMGKARNTLYL